MLPVSVMAGLRPGHPRSSFRAKAGRGCPGRSPDITESNKPGELFRFEFQTATQFTYTSAIPASWFETRGVAAPSPRGARPADLVLRRREAPSRRMRPALQRLKHTSAIPGAHPALDVVPAKASHLHEVSSYPRRRVSSTPRPLDWSPASLEYWIARSSRATTEIVVRSRHALGFQTAKQTHLRLLAAPARPSDARI